MLKLIILIVFCYFSTVITAQTTLYGNVQTEEDSMSVIFGTVILYEQDSKPIDTVLTNVNGDYSFILKTHGQFQLMFRYEGYISVLVTHIPISDTIDSIQVNANLKPVVRHPNCSESAETIRCPYCSKNDLVFEAFPGMMVSYNFGHSKRKYKKYIRKRNRRGYETTLSNGKTIVWNVLIEGEDEKFFSLEYCWFCARDKKMF